MSIKKITFELAEIKKKKHLIKKTSTPCFTVKAYISEDSKNRQKNT